MLLEPQRTWKLVLHLEQVQQISKQQIGKEQIEKEQEQVESQQKQQEQLMKKQQIEKERWCWVVKVMGQKQLLMLRWCWMILLHLLLMHLQGSWQLLWRPHGQLQPQKQHQQ
jgi:hypothetical protein